MNVYVITACYNCVDKIGNYLDSFNKSLKTYLDLDINFKFIFINDEPEMESKLTKIIESKLKSRGRVSFKILNNSENIGVTRSRNKGARYIKKITSRMGENERINSYVIYFDADDTWKSDSVLKLSLLPMLDNRSVFLPVDVTTIPINKKCKGTLKLGEFCTFIPLQECIYCWRLDKVHELINSTGYLWYENQYLPDRYFPEDIAFLKNRKDTCLVIPELSICNRDYSGGNIAHDWEGTILRNKKAFALLASLHRENMKYNKYPQKLVEYVEYLEKLTK